MLCCVYKWAFPLSPPTKPTRIRAKRASKPNNPPILSSRHEFQRHITQKENMNANWAKRRQSIPNILISGFRRAYMLFTFYLKFWKFQMGRECRILLQSCSAVISRSHVVIFYSWIACQFSADWPNFKADGPELLQELRNPQQCHANLWWILHCIHPFCQQTSKLPSKPTLSCTRESLTWI